MSTPQKPNDPSTAMKAKGLVASVVGGAVGIYSGINLVIPLAFSGAVWYLGSKLLRPRDIAYLPAISIQAGHMLWLALGMVILGSMGANVIDLVVLGAGVAWLWIRPSLWPVVFLSIFQAIALAVNVAAIASEPVASTMHKALVVHIALRVAALFYMWRALVRARSQKLRGTADDA